MKKAKKVCEKIMKKDLKKGQKEEKRIKILKLKCKKSLNNKFNRYQH